MDLNEFDQRIEKDTRDMPPEFRPWLPEVLTASDEDRAKAIGKLHEATEGSALVDCLLD